MRTKLIVEFLFFLSVGFIGGFVIASHWDAAWTGSPKDIVMCLLGALVVGVNFDRAEKRWEAMW